MKNNLISRMRYERIKKGWTLDNVSMQVGISNQAVSKIEKKKKKNPSYNIIVKLENLFGLSHRELFFLVENTL